MADTQKVTVRFPISVMEDIEDIMHKYGYRNISSVLKDAAMEFIKLKKATPGENRYVIAFPAGQIDRMNDLINMGEFMNEEEIISTGVRDYLDKKMVEVVEKYTVYSQSVRARVGEVRLKGRSLESMRE